MAVEQQLSKQQKLLPRTINFVPAKKSGGIGEADSDDDGKAPQPPYLLYPQAKVRALLLERKPRPVGRGLRNGGNTCFINCILQSLTHTRPLQNYLMSKEHSATCDMKGTGGFCAMCLFESHVHETLTGGHSVFYPNAILKRIKQIGGKHLRVGRQEDAHEFFCNLLDNLHRALLRPHQAQGEIPHVVRRTTLIHQLFGGYLRSQVLCTQCKGASTTFDPYLDLSVEVKKYSSVEKALQGFTAKDVLSGDNKYKCRHCKKAVVAEKGFTISSLPPVFILQLKRFEYTPRGRVKIAKEVKFGTSIDLAPFTASPQRKALYRLYAVVVHSGHSAKSGHYFAFAKHASGTWYEYNDETVRAVSEQTILRQQAYLLFYEAADFTAFSAPEEPAAPRAKTGADPAGASAAQAAVPLPKAAATDAAPRAAPMPTPPSGVSSAQVSPPVAPSGNGSAQESSPVPPSGNKSLRPAAAPAPLPVEARQLASTAAPSHNASAESAATEREACIVLQGSRSVGSRTRCRSRSLSRLCTLRRQAERLARIAKRRAGEPQGTPAPKAARIEAQAQVGNDQREGDVCRDVPQAVSSQSAARSEPFPVQDRLHATTSCSTQFGLAKVDRWEEEEFDQDGFENVQRSLQPLPERRDAQDAEYDTGKKKHKPRKAKQSFAGKSAFDREERRRQRHAR